MRYLISIFLLSVIFLKSPHTTMAQPWPGISFSLASTLYQSSGKFVGTPTSDFFDVENIPVNHPYKIEGMGIGYNIGYQLVIQEKFSLYTFMSRIESDKNNKYINGVDKSGELSRLSYVSSGIGTEGRYWWKQIFMGGGLTYSGEKYNSSVKRSEFVRETRSKKFNPELGLIALCGYEHPKSNLIVRLYYNLVPKLENTNMSGRATVLGLNIGYRLRHIPK